MVIFIISSKSETVNEDDNIGAYTGFLILAVLVIPIVRPLCIWVYYKFLYEPDNKVEDYEIDTKRSNFTQEDTKKEKVEDLCEEVIERSDLEKEI
jgi:hypothetical protein